MLIWDHTIIRATRVFVSTKLTFSENLKYLNLPLLVGVLSEKKLLPLASFVLAGQSIQSRKFKHLKYSENVNFIGTNDFESILIVNANFEKIRK